jgi:RecA-family ATPase
VKTDGGQPMSDVSQWVDDYVPPGSRDSNRNYGPAAPKRDSRDGRRKPFKGLVSSAAFLAGMTPPDYLVHGLIMRGGTYTLTGNTGHCKTLLAILVAIRTALGQWFLGRQCRKSRVVFFAGENPDNVRYQFYGMCAELDVKPDELDISWHDGVFSIEDALSAVKAELAAHADLGLCIFDSLQAFFEGDDDNQNAEMLKLAVSFRELTEGIRISHPA